MRPSSPAPPSSGRARKKAPQSGARKEVSTMDETFDPWTEAEMGCLLKALKLLEQETIPTAGTVGMVKTLIETAIVIDERDYRWKSPFISR